MKNIHKVGAMFYVLWGVLHIFGGGMIMMQDNSVFQIAMQATGTNPEEFQSLSNQALSGILSYHAYNIVWFGVFAIVVSLAYNWKNIRLGYWLNLLVLSAVELGLVIFLLLPGYQAFSSGGIGISLFVLAVIFSSLGYKNSTN